MIFIIFRMDWDQLLYELDDADLITDSKMGEMIIWHGGLSRLVTHNLQSCQEQGYNFFFQFFNTVTTPIKGWVYYIQTRVEQQSSDCTIGISCNWYNRPRIVTSLNIFVELKKKIIDTLTNLLFAHGEYPADQDIVRYCMLISVPLRFDSSSEIFEPFAWTEYSRHLCLLKQLFQDNNHWDQLNFCFYILIRRVLTFITFFFISKLIV